MMLATQSAEIRVRGEALIQQADKLLCESWNERMWADGGPVSPSPTVDQAINGGYPWLETECSRCKTPNKVYLAALKLSATCVHEFVRRLRCQKCTKAGQPTCCNTTSVGSAPAVRGHEWPLIYVARRGSLRQSQVVSFLGDSHVHH